MALKVEIDKRSGFCGGVIRAISKAERFLDSSPGKRLYSLGAIVHNEAELSRLGSKGLVTISHEDIGSIPSPETETLLIRAHGEPPSTYSKAREAGVNVIDCTCPVVLRLQRDIREAYGKLHSYSSQNESEGSSSETVSENYGQVIIFGKVGHAEVLGLLGQVDGDAVVIENMTMLQSYLEDGTIRVNTPLEIFSQTTKSPTEYAAICETLSKRAKAGLTVHETICSQVASRHEELATFASSHDIILFVSGASSSNGKVLCDLCKSRNARTYHISSTGEIDPSWLGPDDSVGICGATSTPRWLLEEVAEAVKNL